MQFAPLLQVAPAQHAWPGPPQTPPSGTTQVPEVQVPRVPPQVVPLGTQVVATQHEPTAQVVVPQVVALPLQPAASSTANEHPATRANERMT